MQVRYYYLKNYQGNNSVVLNQNGVVQQINHYYPYGSLMGEGYNVSSQPYRYGGKELVTLEGLNLSDFGARWLDSPSGTFTTMDPLCEDFQHLSPYLYCAGNPIKYIDPSGMEFIYIEDGVKYQYLNKNGTYAFFDPIGNKYDKNNEFVKILQSALLKILSVEKGKKVVDELISSKFTFEIRKGENSFKTESVNRSQLNTLKKGYESVAGAGGIIYWDPSNLNSGPIANYNTTRPAYIGLAHEIGHADSSNKGLSNHSRYDPYNSNIDLRNVAKDEIRAIKFENIIRKGHGLPLRRGYSIDSNGDIFMYIE